MPDCKQTVVFDFDGVIHSYSSGWCGTGCIPDPPVPGIKEAIFEIRSAGYECVVVSTRCATPEGAAAIKQWLHTHDIMVDGVMKEKPPAIVYIDDRAICFDGRCDSLLEKIKNFKPWNKKGNKTMNDITNETCDAMKTENLTFGQAIEAMKAGHKVARAGWNGKNQYVELATCISYKNSDGDIVNVDHLNIGNKAVAFVGTSGVQMGWLASQADILAEDWYIVEGKVQLG